MGDGEGMVEAAERPVSKDRLSLGSGVIVEYVGGPAPYLWIGEKDGRYIGSVSVKEMRAFLRGRSWGAGLDLADLKAIAGFLERLDKWGHDLNDARSDNELCLAYDVTLGWGPGASDWERSKTPALEAFHKLFAFDTSDPSGSLPTSTSAALAAAGGGAHE